jgi:hypothetical protein
MTSMAEVNKVRAMLARRGGAAVGMGFGGGAGVGGCGTGMPVWDQGFGYYSNGMQSFNPGQAIAEFMGGNIGGAMPQSQAMLLSNPGNQVPQQFQNPNGGQWPGCGPGAGPSNWCALNPSARGLQKVELGFATAPIAAGATATLNINPPIIIQPLSIRIGSDHAGELSIVTITSGVQELLLGGAVPARLATEVSICGVALAHTTVIPGVGLNVTFQNTNAPGGAPVVASGSFTVIGGYC